MKLADKILSLRKKQGMSQEELAHKLQVSRQAISRWEMGTTLPDASNLLQLSRLFGVTTDYLLDDEYDKDADRPTAKTKEKPEEHERNRQTAFLFLMGLNIMIFLCQLVACFVLQSTIFTFAGMMLTVSVVVGFEYAYRKNSPHPEAAVRDRRKFYVVTWWLAVYFPVRILLAAAARLYPRPYSGAVFEILAVGLYLLISIFFTQISKKRKTKE